MRYLRRSIVLPLVVVGVLAVTQQAEARFSIGAYWNELKDWFVAGGNSMWFILACSILFIAFTVERFIRLTRSRMVPSAFATQARQLWRQGRFNDIVALCDRDNSLLARTVRMIVLHRQIPLSDLRTIAGDTLNSELRLHQRRIHPIAVAATVAPLLGLFGTVTGMIGAFSQFKDLGETGDPAIFAGNISLALITTEAGLLVAIPALTAWHYFRNRTNAYSDELDSIVQELLIDWFIEPAQNAAHATPALAGAAR